MSKPNDPPFFAIQLGEGYEFLCDLRPNWPTPQWHHPAYDGDARGNGRKAEARYSFEHAEDAWIFLRQVDLSDETRRHARVVRIVPEQIIVIDTTSAYRLHPISTLADAARKTFDRTDRRIRTRDIAREILHLGITKAQDAVTAEDASGMSMALSSMSGDFATLVLELLDLVEPAR